MSDGRIKKVGPHRSPVDVSTLQLVRTLAGRVWLVTLKRRVLL